MKECPHCHELLGDSAENCFNCHYNFRLGRVPNDEDQEYLRQIDANRVDREQNFQMYKAQEQFQDEQIRLKLKEDIATIQQNKLKVIMQNPYYEYDVVQLKDSKLGYVSADRLQKPYTNILRLAGVLVTRLRILLIQAHSELPSVDSVIFRMSELLPVKPQKSRP